MKLSNIRIFSVLTIMLLFIAINCGPAIADRGSDLNKAKSLSYFEQARDAFQGGDFASCIALCKKAVYLDNHNKYAFVLMAEAYAQTGDNYNADLSYRSALTWDYNYLDARNSYGQFELRRGKLPEAQKQFEECIRIDPKYPFAYHHLGEVLQKRGDIDKAIENYDTACQLKPDYWQAQRDLGMAIFERSKSGDVTEAVDKLQIASKLVPNNPLLHYYLGTIYCAQGTLDTAEVEFRQALSLDPKFAASHFELAKLRYFRGDPDRSLSELKQTESINPLYSEGQSYPRVDPIQVKKLEAQCYELKGDLISSVELWKSLAPMTQAADNRTITKHIKELENQLRKNTKKPPKITFDPKEVEKLVYEGMDEFEGGNVDSAKSTFQKVLELNPQSYEALQNLGFCLEAQGDLNGALAQFQKAQLIWPKYDGALYNIAFILEKLNLQAEAGLMYQKFHELAGKYPYDPKHVVALQQEEARERAREEQIKKRGY